MERENRIFKPLIYGVVIFITLGITIANETLSRFGLEENYVYIFSLAFIFAALLLGRNLLLIGLVIVGIAALNLPEATLIHYHLDKDLLLGAVCAVILLPTINRLILK